MKTLLRFSLFICAIVAFAAQGFAQVSTSPYYRFSSVLSAATQNVARSATSNYTSDIYPTKSGELAVALSFKLNNTGSSSVTVNFTKSVDGVTFETTPTHSIVVAANGATAVNVVTNFSIGSVGAVRLASIVNGNSGGDVTNLVVKVGWKQDK